jgi:hypothetical protein
MPDTSDEHRYTVQVLDDRRGGTCPVAVLATAPRAASARARWPAASRVSARTDHPSASR